MSSAALARAARSPAPAAAPTVRARPSRSSCRGWHLHGQRRWNRRLWRRFARAPEAVTGCPVAEPRPGSAKPARAAGRALRRHRSRAGALPRRARRSVALGELGEEGVGVAPLIDALDDVSRDVHAAHARLARSDLLEAFDDRLQAQRDGGVVQVAGLRDRFEAAQRLDGCARALLHRVERRGEVVRRRRGHRRRRRRTRQDGARRPEVTVVRRDDEPWATHSRKCVSPHTITQMPIQ
eukprot:scaffold64807_cov66-Phaeocystis_antarctica.AAC.2